jgi:hypothetical protein
LGPAFLGLAATLFTVIMFAVISNSGGGVSDATDSSPCVAVTVPDTTSYGAAGDTFVESPVGTATVGKKTGAAFPAVLPGAYALDLDCTTDGAFHSLGILVPGPA